MICKNCGSDMREGQRFCERCGTAAELPVNEPEAAVTEVLSEETAPEEYVPAAETEVLSEETFIPAGTVDEEIPLVFEEEASAEPKKKKSKKGLKITAVVLAVLVLLGGVGFLFRDKIEKIIVGFSSPERQLQYAYARAAGDLADDLFSNLKTVYNGYDENVSTEGRMTLAVSDDFMRMFGLNGLMEENELDIDYVMQTDFPLIRMYMAFFMGGTELFAVDIYEDVISGDMTIEFPGLIDGVLEFNANDASFDPNEDYESDYDYDYDDYYDADADFVWYQCPDCEYLSAGDFDVCPSCGSYNYTDYYDDTYGDIVDDYSDSVDELFGDMSMPLSSPVSTLDLFGEDYSDYDYDDYDDDYGYGSSMTDYLSMLDMEELEDAIMGILPSGDMMEDIVGDVVEAALDVMDGVTEEKSSFTAGGVTRTATCLKAEVTTDLVAKMAVAALRELRTNGKVKDYIGDLLDNIGDMMGLGMFMPSIDQIYAEYQNVIDELIAEVEDYGSERELLFTLYTWIDSDYNILAVKIESPDTDEGTIFLGKAENGNETGYEMSAIAHSGEVLQYVGGKVTESGGKVNAEYKLVSDDTDLIYLNVIDGSDKGGTLLLSFSEEFADEFAYELGVDISEYALKLSSEIISNKEQTIAIAIVDADYTDKEYASLVYDALLTGKVSLELQSGDSDDIESWAADIDLEELYDRFEEAGISQELLAYIFG